MDKYIHIEGEHSMYIKIEIGVMKEGEANKHQRLPANHQKLDVRLEHILFHSRQK